MSVITVRMLDRRIKFTLSGVFETTPFELFLMLGGTPHQFDGRTRYIMEWHLNVHAYTETEVSTSYASTPTRLRWVRTIRWVEDRPWIDGDEAAMLAQVEASLID